MKDDQIGISLEQNQMLGVAAITDVVLTDGAVIALARLMSGKKLQQERNRSKMTWVGTDELLHHLTFKSLDRAGAIKAVKGKVGFTTFGITAKGKRLSG
jgi:hypothetical protein